MIQFLVDWINRRNQKIKDKEEFDEWYRYAAVKLLKGEFDDLGDPLADEKHINPGVVSARTDFINLIKQFKEIGKTELKRELNKKFEDN